MRTTDVKNAYNLRRKYFSSEYNIGNRATRGIITRSILNTDLSARSYENLVNLSSKFDNFELIKLTKTQQKLADINEWILNATENTAWISEIKTPSRLHSYKKELESILPSELKPKDLFERFYRAYINLILIVLEDALIRIYIVEDTKSLVIEIHSMLNNLSRLNPIGGLKAIINSLIEIYYESIKSDEQNPHVQFIDTYAHTTFVWSQCAELISDFIDQIETGEPISLEKANETLQKRMGHIAGQYKTF